MDPSRAGTASRPPRPCNRIIIRTDCQLYRYIVIKYTIAYRCAPSAIPPSLRDTPLKTSIKGGSDWYRHSGAFQARCLAQPNTCKRRLAATQNPLIRCLRGKRTRIPSLPCARGGVCAADERVVKVCCRQAEQPSRLTGSAPSLAQGGHPAPLNTCFRGRWRFREGGCQKFFCEFRKIGAQIRLQSARYRIK